MLFRYIFLITLLSCLGLHSPGAGQEQEGLKQGIVRIENSRLKESGTGFIIAIDQDNLYIVTAAHVVRGSSRQEVYFFNNPDIAVTAKVIDREIDDLKGLAVLLVTEDHTKYSGLNALAIGKASSLLGGESIQVIGFPRGTTFWTVSNGNVARLEGRNLVLSGRFEPGNSGGPVLLGGQVIGLVTDADSASYAVGGESVSLYFDGIRRVRKLDPVPGNSQKRVIRITEIPRYDPRGGDRFVDIAGDVAGVDPDEVRVVLYSLTNGWYVQPEEDSPFTSIGQDNKWSARIHPGTRYAALLVKSTYQPKTTRPVDNLPTIGGDILAFAEVPGKKP
jgi:hypothetical protein